MKKTETTIGVIVVIFGVLFIATIPPLWGYDEVAHVNRTYEITEGNLLLGSNSRGGVGSDVPSNLVELEYAVYADLMDNKVQGSIFERHDISDRTVYEKLTARKFDSNMQPSIITAAYSPVAYLGPAAGLGLARLLDLPLGQAITAARIFGLMTYCGLVWLAIRIVRNMKIRWLIAAAALLPVAVFQASTISADTLGIGLAFVLIASLLRLRFGGKLDTRTSKLLLACSVVCLVVLPLIKINYVLFAPLALLIPRAIFSMKKHYVWVVVTALVAPIVVAAVWNMLVPAVTNINQGTPRPDGLAINPKEQIKYTFQHPIDFVGITAKSILNYSGDYFAAMTTRLGWNEVPAPFIFSLVSFATLIIGAIGGDARIRRDKWFVWGAALVGAMIMLGIFFAMYAMFNPVSGQWVEGVQGRYFVPFIILLIMPFTLLPVKINAKERALGVFLISCSVTVLIASVVSYAKALF